MLRATRRPFAAHGRLTAAKAGRVSTDRRSTGVARRRRIGGPVNVAGGDLIVQRVALLRLHQQAPSPVDGVRRRSSAGARVAAATTGPSGRRQIAGGRRQAAPGARRLAREALLLSERIASISTAGRHAERRPVRDRHLAGVGSVLADDVSMMMMMMMMMLIINRRRRSAELTEVRQLPPPSDNSIRDEVAVVVVAADWQSMSVAVRASYFDRRRSACTRRLNRYIRLKHTHRHTELA